MEQMNDEQNETVKGAIIRRRLWARTDLSGVIGFHYAIDTGDGDIVHFNPVFGNKLKCINVMKRQCVPGIVTKDPKPPFYKWDIVSRPESEHKADTIIKTALLYVGQRKEYNLLECNCEHFANFCKEAAMKSNQTKWFKSSVAGVGTAASASVTGVATAASISAATPPAATLFGSASLGSFAAELGLISAPVASAPAWLPVAAVVGGTILTATAGVGLYIWITKSSSSFGEETNSNETEFGNALQQRRAHLGDCIVCYQNVANIRYRPCDHIHVCKACSEQLDNCPICQQSVQEKVEI